MNGRRVTRAGHIFMVRKCVTTRDAEAGAERSAHRFRLGACRAANFQTGSSIRGAGI
jgi:hypothetical protein